MATHGVIQAIAAQASVSVLVLTPTPHSEETIRAAQDYYSKTCRSLSCHSFPHLNPSRSLLVKAWHYLTGYPRQGFWSREAEQILIEQIRDTGCQVLWCNTTHEAKYLRAGKQMNCRTVITTQNVESDLIRQEMKATSGISRFVTWVRARDLRRLEKMAARWADVVTAITNVDLEYYARLKSADRVFLLPFGFVAVENAARADVSREEPNTICFVGSMDWPPNAKAARHLVHEIMPLVWEKIPEAKCFLVGRNPDAEVQILASDRVVVTGRVPSVREYYDRAPVMVVPIQGVGGVKIKLIDAMAAGKAVVTTSAGAAGLNVIHGKHLLIADTPGDFANAVVRLLENREERQKLEERSRRFVAEHVSPKETEGQVNRILQCLKQL
ncbi:MAG: hypothetical protein JWO45_938 [Spartobacteria bacterium]|nr:hypothetical protein [Spartobacteria bacterium]